MQPIWDWLHDYATRWHDFWEIIGAVGSAAAVVVALSLGYRDNKTRARAQADELTRLELERDEARAAEHAQSLVELGRQARGIAAWFEHVPQPIPKARTGSRYGDSNRLPVELPIVTVSNHSPLPVFDVVVRLRIDEGLQTHVLDKVQVLPPQATRTWNLDEHNEVQWYVREPSASVEFRDANEVSWRRAQDGTLHRRALPEERFEMT